VKRFRRALHRYRRDTEAQPQSIERLRERLGISTRTQLALRELLRELPEPERGAKPRVQARLAARRGRRTPTTMFFDPSVRREVAAAGVATILAVGALLSWRLAATVPESEVPPRGANAVAEGPAVVAPETEPRPLEPTELAAPLDWTVATPSPGVSLRFRGSGHLSGSTDAPEIRWRSGTIEVEVEAGRGIDLAVRTREAQVQVVGTGFVVRRDVLGTSVQVLHGEVETICSDGTRGALRTDERVLCLPTDPAGLLARARALQQQGQDFEEVLSVVEQGLDSAGGSGPVWSELVYLKAELLAAMERWSEARAAAWEYLQSGATARRTELQLLLGDP
jgi:hypothetical protein